MPTQEPPFSTILLFGLPGTGTSWLGKILDSHPGTLYRNEPDSLSRLSPLPLVADADQGETFGDAIRSFNAALPGIRETSVTGSLPVFPKDYLTPSRYRLQKLAIWATKVPAFFLGTCAIPDFTGASEMPDLQVVWKSTSSVARIGLIGRSIPWSRGTLLVRHPCGFVASVLRANASRDFPTSAPALGASGNIEALLEVNSAKRKGLTLEDFRNLSLVERLAWQWTLYYEKAMEDIEHLNGFDLLRYEDLCRYPFRTTRAIMDRYRMELSPQTVEFLNTSILGRQADYYEVQKAASRHAFTWKGELSGDQIGRILAVTEGSPPMGLYEEALPEEEPRALDREVSET
ncbi:MAG TPA: hypothetical protein VKA48_10345 [Gammaproteobacteria bacterium]|nr:hypothetical protein [Gammaproteobacteria bacterium]